MVDIGNKNESLKDIKDDLDIVKHTKEKLLNQVKENQSYWTGEKIRDLMEGRDDLERFWNFKAKSSFFYSIYSMIKDININPNDGIYDYYLKVVEAVKSADEYAWSYGNWPDYIHYDCKNYVLNEFYKMIPEKYLNRALRKINRRGYKKIFLSYSSSDKEIVKKVGKELENRGIDIWYDENIMTVGDELHSKIAQGIDESQFFCIFLSKKSIKSKWVQVELRQAIQKDIESLIKILPIIIDKCEVPGYLRGLVYAELHRENDTLMFSKFIDKIVKAIDY